MRLFVAVDLEPELRETVMNVENNIRKAGADVKLVKPENLHFTVNFLGEVPESDVERIGDIVCEEASKFTQFRISIQGAGYFGSPGRIRTLWLGVKKGKEHFTELVNALGKALNNPNRKQASIHLTVGRVKSGKNREELLHEIARMKDVNIGEMTVKHVKLKKSVLERTGPMYTDIKVCRLRQLHE